MLELRAMKLFTLVPLSFLLAFAAPSCSYTAEGYQAAGYTSHDAYHRGLTDGSGDRLHGLAYDPHINEDRTLPRAHRKDYLWGYVDGFRNSGSYYVGGQ